jgi:hypothetical protein
MDRMPITNEDENLRRYGVKESTLKHVDVTGAVMNRIYNIELGHKPGHILSAFNKRKRSAIITSAFAIILLATITVQAATGYLEIRNKAGVAVVSVKEPSPPYLSSPSKKIDQLLAQYYEQAQATLQPGEFAAYYINDEAAYNPYDTINPLKYVYKSPDTPTYEDYVQTAEQTLAPQLTPTFMPKGFKYTSGDIVPAFPWSQGDQYKSLLENLLNKAETTQANEKLIVEPVPWTQSGSVTLMFTNGKTNILLTATKGIAITFHEEDQVIREITTISDQEVMYMDARSSAASVYTNRVSWYNEQSSVIYSIQDGIDSPLNKEDFLKIAEGIISEK